MTRKDMLTAALIQNHGFLLWHFSANKWRDAALLNPRNESLSVNHDSCDSLANALLQEIRGDRSSHASCRPFWILRHGFGSGKNILGVR